MNEIRLASVWAQALRIWKSEVAARDFLYRAHPLLGERRPIDLVLENEIGAELVRGVIGRLEHGSAVEHVPLGLIRRVGNGARYEQ